MELRTPQHVQAELDRLGTGIQVAFFESSTRTAEQAAASIGTVLGSIVKSLCFLVDENRPVIVLTAGDRMVDERKLAELHGIGRKKVRIASAEATVAFTGYAPGGVPPLGHVERLPIFVDASLQRFSIVYAAAGAPNAIFPISHNQLVAITSGRVVNIVRETEA